jgi:hypothetical protein
MLKAIRLKYKQTLLYTEEQKVSEKTGGIYTEYRLSLNVTTEKYNEMHPNDVLNPNIHKSKYAQIPLKRAVKAEEMFLYLFEEIWKKLESGEMYEQGERAKERIRSRYHTRRVKGAGGSTGVLQDAQVSEELSGGVSERNERVRDEAGEGDIGEA